MTRNILTTILFFLIALTVHAQFSEEDLLKTDMPLLVINTIDGTDPTCEYVFPPEGTSGIGVSTTNESKNPSRVQLLQRDKVLYDSGDYLKDISGAIIKIRGNASSYYSTKKQYKLKLEKKADLLLRGDKKYNDREWVLSGQTGSMNIIATLKLSQLLQMPWTPEYRFVNFILNGQYRGVYLLMELVKRNTDCRINVSKTGYIVEDDLYWWNEPLHFGETMKPYTAYTMKYPDADDITAEQLTTIQQSINDMEGSIADGTYGERIDVENFAAWLLANDILGYSDTYGVNLYYAKADDTAESKVFIPNLWDFDSAFQTTDTWSALRRRSYFPQLLTSPNRDFVHAYKELWASRGKAACNDVVEFMNGQRSTDDFKTLDEAFATEWKFYYEKSYGPREEAKQTLNDWYDEIVIDWFPARVAWLSTQIPLMDDATGIRDVTRQPTEGVCYDLMGRRMAQPQQHGIFIRNGRKHVQ